LPTCLARQPKRAPTSIECNQPALQTARMAKKPEPAEADELEHLQNRRQSGLGEDSPHGD
jgi:hypothetical protein